MVPALTAMCAAVLALSEKEPEVTIGWIISSICSSIYLSSLIGDYQAAQAMLVTGAVAVFLLAMALCEFSAEEETSRWFVAIAAVILAGVPIGGWGWARYLEYLGLVRVDSSMSTPQYWICVGLKILSDLIMGLALWGIVRERWSIPSSQSKVRWEMLLPAALVALGSTAVAVGGRVLSGILGQTELELFPSATWFERLIQIPKNTKVVASALEQVGTDADVLARVLVLGVLIVPAAIALLWLFRDGNEVQEFRARLRKFLVRFARLDARNGTDSLVWERVFKPVSYLIGTAGEAFDRQVLDRLFGDIWKRPARFIRKAFAFFEAKILDRGIVDGMGSAVATLGKSLRLVQNGQVQFYFTVGLILISAVVFRFIYK
jgi:hypothetical protein